MGLYDIKSRFRQILNLLADRLALLHPDAITAAGLGASGLALLSFFGASEQRWFLLIVQCLSGWGRDSFYAGQGQAA